MQRCKRIQSFTDTGSHLNQLARSIDVLDQLKNIPFEDWSNINSLHWNNNLSHSQEALEYISILFETYQKITNKRINKQKCSDHCHILKKKHKEQNATTTK
jgi:hypothetical protein